MGSELQLPCGGDLHLAAGGPAQSPAHKRCCGNVALSHFHVRRGGPHYTVEVSISSGEENQR